MRTRLILCAALLSPTLVHAASYTSSFEFAVSDQSIWGNDGPLPITNASPPPQFYGIDESIFNFGNANPTPGSSLYFGGYASGRVGVEVDFQFDSGTVDAIVPYSAGLNFTYAQFNAAGGPATIQTEAFLQDHAFLQTRSPDLQFGADLVFGMTAGIYGGGCIDAWLVSGCANFNESFSIDDGTGTGDPYKLELAAVNRNGDGEFRLLPKVQELLQQRADREDTRQRLEEGDKAANEKNPDGTTKNTRQRSKAILKHLVKVGAGLPDLATADVVLPELGTSGGAVGGVLQTARAEDNFLNLEIDIDGILTSIGTLPPLEIEASLDAGVIAQGSLSANLADVTLKPSLTLAQQFSLTPVLEMDLQLSREMEVTVHNKTTMMDEIITTDVISNLVAGVDSFLLQWDDGAPLFITPTYRLSEAAFVNDLDLGLDLALNLKLLNASAQLEILGFDLPKFAFGPLIEEEFNLEGILAPGDEGFGFLDIEQWAFELDALKSLSFVGEAITLFPADATFTGEGSGFSWQTEGNWENGAIGDLGNDVVIGDAIAVVDAASGGGDSIVEVGNVAIADGAGVNGLYILEGGHFLQANGAMTFSNEGFVGVNPGATLTVAAPIDGGGTISIVGGLLQGPIDLNGQRLLLGGGAVVEAQGTFDIDAASSIDANTNADINVMNVNVSRNEGTIAATANGATLNIAAENNQSNYIINNVGGLIEASGSARIVLSHDNLATPTEGTEGGRVKIIGGLLSTDSSPTSLIETPGVLWLDGVTNDGKVTVGNQLWLDNTVTNNGELSASKVFVNPMFSSTHVPTELAGTGTLKLTPGGILAAVGRITLINGEGHTIAGSGVIGNANVANLVVDNRGTISAATGGLTIAADTSGGQTRTFINDGGTAEAGTGSLTFGEGDYDFAGGLVHARGGNVTLGTDATTVGGDVTGPGGIWRVSAGRTLSISDAANQWVSLTNNRIRDGEVILEGSGDLIVDGESLRNGSLSSRFRLDRVGNNGTLRLVDSTLDLSAYQLIPGSTSVAEQFSVETGGQLLLENNSTFKTRADIDLLGSGGEGQLRISSGALVAGSGLIDSDAIINQGGTVRAEGGALTIDGGLVGSGNYEATNGSPLRVDLGTCTIFGFSCPFTRVVSAEGELTGNNFLVSSTDAFTELRFIGANSNPFIRKLTGSRVDLDGPLSFVNGISSAEGEKSLAWTLETLDNTELVLSNGQQFSLTTKPTDEDPAGVRRALTATNGSILEVSGTDSRYTGSQLNLQTGSAVNLRGGTLDVGGIAVQSGTVIDGFGTIENSVINNEGSVRADNGELEIRNSTVNQPGIPDIRSLEATAVDATPGTADPASILRLTNTQVNNGLVGIGARALLTGNGTFNNLAVVNYGTVFVGEASTRFINSALLNFSTGDVIVSNATLSMWGSSSRITNTASATGTPRIEVFSATDDSMFSMIDIQGGVIDGGEVVLVTEGINSTPPATVSILGGFGTLNDVDLTVDEFSLVDANFDGLVLEINVGTGSIDNAGTMQASSGGILRLRNGVMTGAGDVIAHNGSVVEIENMDFVGANLSTRGDGMIRDIGSSTFRNLENDALFEVSGTGNVTLAGNITNVNDQSSVIHVRAATAPDGGVLQLADGGVNELGDPVDFALTGGTLIVDAGARVIGNGQVFRSRGTVITGSGLFDADVIFDGNVDTGVVGTLRPGESPGMVDFMGDVTFGELHDLEIEIGGLLRTTEYDWINVGGTLTLGGTLTVVLYDLGDGLFNPGLGDTFDIFDAAFVTGMFADGGITLPGLDAGLVWNLSSLATDGVLSVAAVPLPPAVWMFLAALTGLISIGKRRRLQP